MKLLIKEGADTTIRNNARLTALELGGKLEGGDSLDIVRNGKEMREEAEEESVKVLVEGPVQDPVDESRRNPGAHPPGSLPAIRQGAQTVGYVEVLRDRFQARWPSDLLPPQRSRRWGLPRSNLLDPWSPAVPWPRSTPETQPPSPSRSLRLNLPWGRELRLGRGLSRPYRRYRKART